MKRLAVLLLVINVAISCRQGSPQDTKAALNAAAACQEVTDPNHIFSPIAVTMSKLNCLHEAVTSLAMFDSLSASYCATTQDPTRCKDIAEKTTYYPPKEWAR